MYAAVIIAILILRFCHSASVSSPATKIEARGRLSSSDWEQAAIEVMAESGIAAVAVEPLARRLGVTKGSFYWHFSNREALLQAALDHWEQRDAEETLGSVEAIPDPRQRLREMFRQVSRERQSHVIFAALLQALDQPLVRPVIARVIQRRIEFLTAAFRQAGLNPAAASNRARLACTAYAGFVQLAQFDQPRLNHDEFAAYVEHVIEALIPA